MKDLKTYITEAIKPPRLSAKNKHLWKNGILDEEKVMEWLKENCDVEGKAEFVDGEINVDGDIIVNDKVKFFPYPFGEVSGRFDCSYCKKLKSLRNCPIKAGHFSCFNCPKITSLEGAPKKVGGDFNCNQCINLTSLEGAPKEVVGSFDCYNCGSEFTEEYVKKICNVKGKIRV